MTTRPTATVIAKARPSDVPILLPLVAQYWRFEGLAGFDTLRITLQLTRLFSEPALGAGWIAAQEGSAVGYLLAVSLFSLEHHGMSAEIDEFFVIPSQRGYGVGAELLHAAEIEFSRAGYSNLSLQLSRDNDTARSFYQRRGYTGRSKYEILDRTLCRERLESTDVQR